jgi:hypothetical protein
MQALRVASPGRGHHTTHQPPQRARGRQADRCAVLHPSDHSTAVHAPGRGVHDEHSPANFWFRCGCLPYAVSALHANLGAAGFEYCAVASRNMRALGALLVLLGLAIAAFAVRRGDTLDDADARQSGDPSASRPIGASAATPAVPISQTVYVPTRQTAAVPAATAAQELPRTPNLDLVSQLQHELTRVGCYQGDINGTWTPSTRRAMEAIVRQLNAKLPTARPEPAHLALVQSQYARICDPCPTRDENQFGRRCANSASRGVLAASIAPPISEPKAADLRKPESEQKTKHGRRGPTEGRMGLGVSNEPPQTAQAGANRIMLLAAVIVQIVMGAARLLRSDPTGTRGPCDQRAMRTAGLGGFLPYCLDGELLLVVECRPPQRCRANARRRRHRVPSLVAILPGT